MKGGVATRRYAAIQRGGKKARRKPEKKSKEELGREARGGRMAI